MSSTASWHSPVAVRRRRALRTLASLLVIAACDSSIESPAEQISSALTVLSTGDLADTILAGVDTLRVLLTDQNGRPIAGRNVAFTVLDSGRLPLLWLLNESEERIRTTWGLTGSTGQARVIVDRGPLAGEARVVVESGPLRDTVRYTILPGAPFSVAVHPTDTGLYVGSSYAPTAVALDLFDNITPVPVPLTVATPGIVSVENGTVRALDFGYAAVVGRVGTLTDTAWVAVVPRATIAGHGRGPGVVTIGLDGTGLQEIPMCPGTIGSGGVRWSPTGTRLVYSARESAPGSRSSIHLVEAAGTCRRLTAASDWHHDPAFSPDEEWIYLRVLLDDAISEIWRMRLDGSGLARIGPAAAGFVRDAWPGVSPDGGTLSFWTTRPPEGLAMMDLATGTVHIHDTDGQAPRWSPQGDLIAYRIGLELAVANRDLTNQRVFEFNSYPFGVDSYYDWSPDGEWLITSAWSTLVLVRVGDGLTIPLKYMGGLVWPAWRPCSVSPCDP